MTRLWWHILARTALFWGQPERALSLYLQCLERFPQDRYAIGCAVALMAKRGETQEALAWLARARALWPADADLWFNTGFLLEQQDCDGEASAAFQQAVQLNPAHDRAWYGLALVCLRQGDVERAAAALRENTRLQPMSPYGWYQLALLEAGRGAPGEAWRLQEHLSHFEPKVAAQLSRELQVQASGRHEVHGQRQDNRPTAQSAERDAKALVAPAV